MQKNAQSFETVPFCHFSKPHKNSQIKSKPSYVFVHSVENQLPSTIIDWTILFILLLLLYIIIITYYLQNKVAKLQRSSHLGLCSRCSRLSSLILRPVMIVWISWIQISRHAFPWLISLIQLTFLDFAQLCIFSNEQGAIVNGSSWLNTTFLSHTDLILETFFQLNFDFLVIGNQPVYWADKVTINIIRVAPGPCGSF